MVTKTRHVLQASYFLPRALDLREFICSQCETATIPTMIMWLVFQHPNVRNDEVTLLQRAFDWGGGGGGGGGIGDLFS